jgi:hypothetical protein
MSKLEIAAERLRKSEQLLICPTPEAIQETDLLLRELAIFVSEHGDELRRDVSRAGERGGGEGFRVLCDRVAKLLEGARRAQWIRMRRITSLTETYTARAETKRWSPPCGNINVRM